MEKDDRYPEVKPSVISAQEEADRAGFQFGQVVAHPSHRHCFLFLEVDGDHGVVVLPPEPPLSADSFNVEDVPMLVEKGVLKTVRLPLCELFDPNLAHGIAVARRKLNLLEGALESLADGDV